MASTANSNAEKPCCRASADGVTRCARRARARTLMHRRFERLAMTSFTTMISAKRLQDGLSTIHPDMPTFRFKRRDAEAAVNYLKFIQEHKKSK